jgi:hypothetical protein
MTPTDTDELHRAMVDDGILAIDGDGPELPLTGLHFKGGHCINNERPSHQPPQKLALGYVEGLVNALRAGSTGPNDILDRAAQALLDLITHARAQEAEADRIKAALLDAVQALEWCAREGRMPSAAHRMLVTKWATENRAALTEASHDR